jgi:hypothetical protein
MKTTTLVAPTAQPSVQCHIDRQVPLNQSHSLICGALTQPDRSLKSSKKKMQSEADGLLKSTNPMRSTLTSCRPTVSLLQPTLTTFVADKFIDILQPTYPTIFQADEVVDLSHLATPTTLQPPSKHLSNNYKSRP